MTVVWTRLALADLDQAHAHISAKDPKAAAGIIERIEQAAAALALFPEMGRIGRVPGTRELVVFGTPFVLPYRTTRRGVQVLAVIHAARRWPDRL